MVCSSMGVLGRWFLNASLRDSGLLWRAGQFCCLRILRINGLTLKNEIPLNRVVIFEVNVLSQCGVVHFELGRFGDVCG